MHSTIPRGANIACAAGQGVAYPSRDCRDVAQACDGGGREDRTRLQTHVADVTAACKCARRRKPLSELAPYEYICKIRRSGTDRFIREPTHKIPGLKTQPQISAQVGPESLKPLSLCRVENYWPTGAHCKCQIRRHDRM